MGLSFSLLREKCWLLPAKNFWESVVYMIWSIQKGKWGKNCIKLYLVMRELDCIYMIWSTQKVIGKWGKNCIKLHLVKREHDCREHASALLQVFLGSPLVYRAGGPGVFGERLKTELLKWPPGAKGLIIFYRPCIWQCWILYKCGNCVYMIILSLLRKKSWLLPAKNLWEYVDYHFHYWEKNVVCLPPQTFGRIASQVASRSQRVNTIVWSMHLTVLNTI